MGNTLLSANQAATSSSTSVFTSLSRRLGFIGFSFLELSVIWVTSNNSSTVRLLVASQVVHKKNDDVVC